MRRPLRAKIERRRSHAEGELRTRNPSGFVPSRWSGSQVSKEPSLGQNVAYENRSRTWIWVARPRGRPRCVPESGEARDGGRGGAWPGSGIAASRRVSEPPADEGRCHWRTSPNFPRTRSRQRIAPLYPGKIRGDRGAVHRTPEPARRPTAPPAGGYAVQPDAPCPGTGQGGDAWPPSTTSWTAPIPTWAGPEQSCRFRSRRTEVVPGQKVTASLMAWRSPGFPGQGVVNCGKRKVRESFGKGRSGESRRNCDRGPRRRNFMSARNGHTLTANASAANHAPFRSRVISGDRVTIGVSPTTRPTASSSTVTRTDGPPTQKTKSVYRVLFRNQESLYELYARKVGQGALFAVEVGRSFDNRGGVLVDPSEERLKSESPASSAPTSRQVAGAHRRGRRRRGRTRMSPSSRPRKRDPFPHAARVWNKTRQGLIGPPPVTASSSGSAPPLPPRCRGCRRRQPEESLARRPEPAAGVPTTLHSGRRRSKKSHEEIPPGSSARCRGR